MSVPPSGSSAEFRSFRGPVRVRLETMAHCACQRIPPTRWLRPTWPHPKGRPTWRNIFPCSRHLSSQQLVISTPSHASRGHTNNPRCRDAALVALAPWRPPRAARPRTQGRPCSPPIQYTFPGTSAPCRGRTATPNGPFDTTTTEPMQAARCRAVELVGATAAGLGRPHCRGCCLGLN